tara:strand:+ start:404 stop:589 length:186 start_codon:yes stop_codon:yes gene_type:complete
MREAKELKNGKVTMFQERIIKIMESIEKARNNDNNVLESIFISELKQCEKMLQVSRQDLNS